MRVIAHQVAATTMTRHYQAPRRRTLLLMSSMRVVTAHAWVEAHVVLLVVTAHAAKPFLARAAFGGGAEDGEDGDDSVVGDSVSRGGKMRTVTVSENLTYFVVGAKRGAGK